MAEELFETFIQRERDRLHAQREAIFTEQQELEQRLASVDRELVAINAYEAAKTGKAPPGRQIRTGAGRGARTRARSGSRREQLLTLIKKHNGLTRGEILEQMGLKGNKSGEMSVSNALTALTKSNQVLRRDRKYVAG